jgi:hypothetical protein
VPAQPRRYTDLIARAQAEAGKYRHQRDGAAAYRDGMLDAAVLGPSIFKLGDLAALRDHAVA